jgi:glucose-1-phosphate adenylyltransferase
MSSDPKAPYARTAMAFVLAGGRGTRLLELTEIRAKPAVFFGGKARIIDFALSNAINSGIRRIGVATQYRAHSLIRHLQRGWNFLRPERNESFDILPASQRVAGAQWYLGTADAVYQNLDIIEDHRPEHVVVLAADHVYRMDYQVMLRDHVAKGADVTIGCIEVPRTEASGFGVIRTDDEGRVLEFIEKSPDPPAMPGKPDRCLASMGIYVFDRRTLAEQLRRDAVDAASSHDFGTDMIPWLVQNGRVAAHRFEDSCIRPSPQAEPYWRDVGTLDAYWEANVALTGPAPELDLFDRDWPIWTYAEITPPARLSPDEEGNPSRVDSSLVAGGCRVSGAMLDRALLFSNCRIESRAKLEGAVILPDVVVGAGARLSKVVVDRGVRIPAGLVAGEDPEADARRFRRTERGVCLITQRMLDRLG